MQPERTESARAAFTDADAWIVARAAADYASEMTNFAAGHLADFAGSREARWMDVSDAASSLRHALAVTEAVERLLCAPAADVISLSAPEGQ